MFFAWHVLALMLMCALLLHIENILIDIWFLCCLDIFTETKMAGESSSRRQTRAKAKTSSDTKMTTRGRPKKSAKSKTDLEVFEVSSDELSSEKPSKSHHNITKSTKRKDRTTEPAGNFE